MHQHSRKKHDYASVYKSMRVYMCLRADRYPPACFMSPCCTGYSICQANLNDLVGSEMCHKGALMDEGEHSATFAWPHSRLMKALTLETPLMQSAIEKQHITRVYEHQKSSNDFLRGAADTHTLSGEHQAFVKNMNQGVKSSTKCHFLEIWLNECLNIQGVLLMHFQVSGLVL